MSRCQTRERHFINIDYVHNDLDFQILINQIYLSYFGFNAVCILNTLNLRLFKCMSYKITKKIKRRFYLIAVLVQSHFMHSRAYRNEMTVFG